MKMMDFHVKDVTLKPDRPKTLLLTKHIDYLSKYGTDCEDFEYNMTEYLRMSGIYWTLTGIELMGASNKYVAIKKTCNEFYVDKINNKSIYRFSTVFSSTNVHNNVLST